MPVYLEPDSAAFLHKIAEAKGTDVQKIVNDLICRDIDLIKSVGCIQQPEDVDTIRTIPGERIGEGEWCE